jgi:predicted AlkP superfamily pyrophosphatase or phosphodiesterase
MRVLNLLTLCVFGFVSLHAQQKKSNTNESGAPKLVVGIVVDQMRWDYLYRYSARYSPNGFNRLTAEGFSCENTFISYTPTYTAAGHTGIYTGSVPAMHGIIGNYWYDRPTGKSVYCTDDSSVTTIGSVSPAGKMSPDNMWATTIGDELRLSNNFRSKVIGIALKDRGAILPAGHSANAAYWFDNASGGWISSSYYMSQLPGWVQWVNGLNLPDQFMKSPWNTLYPINTYVQSTIDDKAYENRMPAEDNMFPHVPDTSASGHYNAFRYTPFANTYTMEMAKAAIEGEALGSRGVTDFLAVSFSSTDYIGHEFGPNSVEVEDTYLRLDKDLADFLLYLDNKMGKGKYLVFLSADHGAAHVPGFMKEKKIPAGVLDDQDVRKKINASVSARFGIYGVVLHVVNYQLYLDHAKITASGKSREEITDFIISEILSMKEIAGATRLHNNVNINLPQKLRNMVINGYNQKRSGDIQFLFKPGFFDGVNKGTTHGTWNPYDSHIPLVWFGWNIKPGKTNRELYMADIAPTVCAMLKIQMPNACVGSVISEVVD